MGLVMLVAGFLPTWFGNTVILMLITSSIGGFYIANVHPRKLVVRSFPVLIRLEGKALQVSDVLTHHLPLAYGLAFVERTGPPTPFLLVTVAYLAINNPSVLYGFDEDNTLPFTLALVMITIIILYVVFFI
jgi:hypothetical protein